MWAILGKVSQWGRACEAEVTTGATVSDTNTVRLDAADWHYQGVAGPTCQLRTLLSTFTLPLT